MPDHIHVLIGMRPHQSISSLVQNVKTESSKWVKAQQFCKGSFGWQEGYGAFSYSKSHVPDVIRYVQNQEIHHRKQTFLAEYRKMLKLFEVDYDEQYIFQELIEHKPFLRNELPDLLTVPTQKMFLWNIGKRFLWLLEKRIKII
jgi:putative transposase